VRRAAIALLTLATAALCRGESQKDVYAALRKLAPNDPASALERAAGLRHAELRDRIERIAFLTAIDRRDAATAMLWAARLADRPWIGELGLHRAVLLARALEENQASAAPAGERFVRAAAMANPVVAVREVVSYGDLPYWRPVFEEAALAAPEEAIAVALGGSPTAAVVRMALNGSKRPDAKLLAVLAANRAIPEGDRPKLGYLAADIAAGKIALDAALKRTDREPDYFHTLVEQRLVSAASRPARARMLDQAIETRAQMLMRELREDPRSGQASELARFTARDLRILAAYGRAEDTETTFGVLFDRYLMPQVRKAGAAALDAPELHLRAFLAEALAHHRLETFLRSAVPAGTAARARLLEGAVSALDAERQPAAEAIAASELIEGTADRPTLHLFAGRLVSEYQRVKPNGGATGYYGLLAARLAGHLKALGNPVPPALEAIAQRCQPYLRTDRTLNAADLFDSTGRLFQAQFFYDDEDGVASFRSFRAAYAADPRWRWQDHGTWIQVSRATTTAAPRRIEIYSNVPFDASGPGSFARTAEGDARRRAMLATVRTAAGGLDPRVVIHRGHAYYLDQTLAHLGPTTRLAYLGSCGSSSKVQVVVERSPDAQIVATRGVGTLSVNDPLLKAINDELLLPTSGGSIEWPAFWQALERGRFRGHSHFGEYIAPHRNEAAILLRGWEEWLASEEAP
jgi:hypothetical protein